MTIFAFVLLGAAFLLFLQSVWALIVSIGYKKSEIVREYAYLERTKYTPNVNTHDRRGNSVYCYTKAWYSYTADGKEYSITDVFYNTKPSELQKAVKVIYQKKRPGSGYLQKITLPHEPFECFACAFVGLLFAGGALFILL